MLVQSLCSEQRCWSFLQSGLIPALLFLAGALYSGDGVTSSGTRSTMTMTTLLAEKSPAMEKLFRRGPTRILLLKVPSLSAGWPRFIKCFPFRQVYKDVGLSIVVGNNILWLEDHSMDNQSKESRRHDKKNPS